MIDHKIHMACGFPFHGSEKEMMLKIMEIAENELGRLPNLDECE